MVLIGSYFVRLPVSSIGFAREWQGQEQFREKQPPHLLLPTSFRLQAQLNMCGFLGSGLYSLGSRVTYPSVRYPWLPVSTREQAMTIRIP